MFTTQHTISSRACAKDVWLLHDALAAHHIFRGGVQQPPQAWQPLKIQLTAKCLQLDLHVSWSQGCKGAKLARMTEQGCSVVCWQPRPTVCPSWVSSWCWHLPALPQPEPGPIAMLPSPAAAQRSSTAAALWLLRRRLPLLFLQKRYQPSLHGYDEHFGMLGHSLSMHGRCTCGHSRP